MIFALLYIFGFNPTMRNSWAQNKAPTNDSSKTLYEQRKIRSIKRFGPRCQTALNGLPEYVDDSETLNKGIKATDNTQKAWQFFELNKNVLEICDPQKELHLIDICALRYTGELDTAKAWSELAGLLNRGVPQNGKLINPRDIYSTNDLEKMGYRGKIKVGDMFVFYQYHDDIRVNNSRIQLTIDTLGNIRYLVYDFFPYPHDNDSDSLLNKNK